MWDLFQKHTWWRICDQIRCEKVAIPNLQKAHYLDVHKEVRTLGSKVKISGLLISPINPTIYKYVGEITHGILTSIPPHPSAPPVFHPFPIAAVVTDQGQHRIQRTAILTLLLCQLNTWTDLLNARGKTEMQKKGREEITHPQSNHIFFETRKFLKNGLNRFEAGFSRNATWKETNTFTLSSTKPAPKAIFGLQFQRLVGYQAGCRSCPNTVSQGKNEIYFPENERLEPQNPPLFKGKSSSKSPWLWGSSR